MELKISHEELEYIYLQLRLPDLYSVYPYRIREAKEERSTVKKPEELNVWNFWIFKTGKQFMSISISNVPLGKKKI